jgi:hypothetical protein
MLTSKIELQPLLLSKYIVFDISKGKDILIFYFFIMVSGRWVGYGYLLLHIHGWDINGYVSFNLAN